VYIGNSKSLNYLYWDKILWSKYQDYLDTISIEYLDCMWKNADDRTLKTIYMQFTAQVNPYFFTRNWVGIVCKCLYKIFIF